MGHGPDSLFLEFQAAVAGRYSLERELGRGGMGVVYLAREVRLDRPVAVKLLPPAKATDAALRERFLREARTAAKLSHPNILPIFSVDEIGGFVFFAMAYVEGETLTERLRARGPLAPTDAARLLREVAWALGYAHERGVVHRDVKPDNILLEAGSGRALVADFGIAAAISGAGSLSGAEVVGTPEFMSPEQALGESVDARSDLYSLGIVGYLALSGRLPFEAERATEVLAKQVTSPPPGLATVVAGVPRRFAQAIDRCLAKDPAERPQSGPQFADQLGQLLEQRRELPLPLRAFVRHDARLDDPTVLVYPFALLGGSVLAGMFLGAGVAVGTLVLGIAFTPLAVLMTRARRLLRAGYDHGDLTLAFKVAIDQDLEERAYTSGLKSASLIEKVLRWIGLIGLGTAIVSIPTFFVDVVPAAWMYFLGMSGAVFSGIPSLVMMQRRRDVDLAVYARLWKGKIGKWLFRWAKALLPARALPASLTHRPTELAIGMAADKLYEDLPKETRARLRELPDTVRRLEVDAGRMRARLEQLNDALGEIKVGPSGETVATRHDRIVTDLRTERELVQQRMADAVAALETIRLNLLRLHAGSGNIQSITTDLGLAKEVAAEVDRLLQGQREIEEML
jgi:eukaryotic-like serine/threonine-protein kinase